MIVLEWSKTQIMCLLILCFVGITYVREGTNLNRIAPRSRCNRVFDWMFVMAEIAVLFDGITACTVNCETVSSFV